VRDEPLFSIILLSVYFLRFRYTARGGRVHAWSRML
jgi:hypothetical protein